MAHPSLLETALHVVRFETLSEGMNGILYLSHLDLGSAFAQICEPFVLVDLHGFLEIVNRVLVVFDFEEHLPPIS